MKAGIHPTYYNQATVTCSCGNSFTTGSTLSSFHVEICGACHPFYTGQQKLVDTEGRVERFEKKQKQAVKTQKERQIKQETKAQALKARREAPKTLREMIEREKQKMKDQGTSDLAKLAAKAVKSAQKKKEV